VIADADSGRMVFAVWAVCVKMADMRFLTYTPGRKFVQVWRATTAPVYRPDAGVFVASAASDAFVELCIPADAFRELPREGQAIELDFLQVHAKRG